MTVTASIRQAVVRRCARVRLSRADEGQTIIEFALIATALLIMSAGLIDVGRAFFQYNAVSAAAIYGARWGSVAGGTCAEYNAAAANSDFCKQLTTNASGNFWQQLGNYPLQGTGAPCPSYGSAPSDYYTASDFDTSTGTTIVGAIAQRFDSSDRSTGFIIGNLTPGFDLSKLKICIATTNVRGSTAGIPSPGDTVSVTIYSPFYPVSALLASRNLLLNASSQHQVD